MELERTGKSYPWPRPRRCPACGSVRLWGHGFVRRYFDGLSRPLFLKRWRCPDCGAVHTCRPQEYWPRVLAPIAIVIASLAGKLAGKTWSSGPSRQRQQYWYRGFRRQSQRDGLPGKALEDLCSAGVIAATHSTEQRAGWAWPAPPYPSFAATAPPG